MDQVQEAGAVLLGVDEAKGLRAHVAGAALVAAEVGEALADGLDDLGRGLGALQEAAVAAAELAEAEAGLLLEGLVAVGEGAVGQQLHARDAPRADEQRGWYS